MYQLSNSQNQLNYRNKTRQIRLLYQKPVAQTSTALILTLGTIAFFGFAAIRPTLSTVSQLIAELEEKKEIEQKLTQKLTVLSSLQEEYMLNQDTLAIFTQAIPEDHQLHRLLLTIEYLAYSSGLDIESLRLNPLTTYGTPDAKSQALSRSDFNSSFPQLKIQLSIQSTMDQLQPFLHQLDDLSRTIYIETTNFNRSEDEDTPDLITTSITMHVFWNDNTSSSTPSTTSSTTN